MLADGLGTKKDESLARQYFEKAASRGDNRASFNLAMMEEQKKNYMGAYQWYELSSAEMSKEEKNKISHRGQAMQLFKASLEQ